MGRLIFTDRRHLDLGVLVTAMESDWGDIGAGNRKDPYKDSGVFGVGAAKMPHSMPTFIVVTSEYRRTSNADDA